MKGPETAPLAEIASSRYLNYALSVITSRALPDIRDGLKPVQRRILYAMINDLHVGPDARFMKCARIVGDVMGKYHPHGDQSIYDAMVRMSQDFAMRYPLVDGHGNFGSLDGDPPAAMRYTEAKLRHIAIELLDELKQETVPFQANYDGTRQEPIVLPAQIPNLLVNGTTGIAVGMATNIPPHNLREVTNALLALIDDPSLQPDQLVRFVKGPDFPTGGMILNDKAELKEIYRTGSGSIRMRGEWELEKDGRKQNLVITSIPYGLEKSALVTRIGELVGARQVPQLVDVRDESTEIVRIVCELKSGASADAAAAYLYKNTPLQSNFNVNMTCLVPIPDGTTVPERVNLSKMLQHFLDFRLVVVTRRHEHEKKQLLARLHLLEGFEKVFGDLDRAIKIIREANGRPEAFAGLSKAFALSEIQCNAVLDLKLYKLSRLEIKEIQKEAREVRARVKEIDAILGSEKRRWAIVRQELSEVIDAYGDPRRTKIQGPVEEVEYKAEDYIIDEDAWVVVTRDGWIKRQRRFTNLESIRVRDGDAIGWLYRGRARQAVTYFTNAGSAYTMRVDAVPMTAGYGEPLGRHFQMGDGEMVVGVVCHDPRCLPAHQPPPAGQAKLFDEESGAEVPPGPYALAVTRMGRTLRFPISAHSEPSTKNGRKYCRLSADFPADQVLMAQVAVDDEVVAVASRETRVLTFPVTQVSILAGPGRGVTAIKMDDKDMVVGAALLGSRRDALTMETSRGTPTVVARDTKKLGNRAGKGTVLLSRVQFTRQVPDPATPVPDQSQIKEDDGPEA